MLAGRIAGALDAPPCFRALALLLPLLLLLWHHDLGHQGDMAFFHRWYLSFRSSAAFYRDGPGVNYPIVGVLLVCGPARLLDLLTGGPLDLQTYRWVLKGTLVAGEIAFILAAAALGSTLGLRRPRALALALYALPATWAGGAHFGQTDIWGTALLLLAAARLIAYRSHGRPCALLLGVLASHLALLSKQLTWFTLPALGILFLVALRAHPPGRRLWAGLVSTLAIPVLIDPFLALPPGYRSHLAFIVLGGGSSHADLVVAGGASLWSLIATPGASAYQAHLLGQSAYRWGLLLFGGAVLVGLAWVWRRRASSASVLLFGGLCNLAMATLLTGVHERYLVHGVPLLILGLAALRAPLPLRLLAWLTATFAGLFVLASVHFEGFAHPLLRVLRAHQPTAVLELLLLLALLGLFVSGPRARRHGGEDAA